MDASSREILLLIGVSYLWLPVLAQVVVDDNYLNEVQSSGPLSCSEGFTELGYYNGTVSQTDSGAPCLRWTEFPDYVLQYPGRGLGEHNYCRNPDRESNPWCFFRQHSGAIGWAYCDCHQGAARLVGGASPGSGRVEVYLNGQWGAVCDSHWTDRDSSVICRQLGLGEIGTASQPSSAGTSSGLFHYERLGCRGDETSLSQCRGRTFITGDCSHGNEAAVVCSPPKGGGPPLRLVGGEEEFEGRVEVYHDGRWGSICDDQWDDRDAEVVCRQLGFGGVAKSWSWAHFGQSSGPILLDAVNCHGNELFLDQCRHSNWEQHNCDHMEDAGVSCSPYTDGVVRLVGGDSPWEGRVEVFHAGDWGTVCDDHWTSKHAQVVCRQLGYRGHADVAPDGSFGEGVGLILLDDVHCEGTETSLLDCRHGIWGRSDCSHSEDVGVRCRGRGIQENNEVPAVAPATGPLLRLLGGGTHTEGRVEVYLHGEWGSICDSGWNNLNAAVVCRQLGYKGEAVAHAGFGQGKGPLHLDQVRCTGKEDFLGECPTLGQNAQGCERREDAGVRCNLEPRTSQVVASPGELTCGVRKTTGKTDETENDGKNTPRSSMPWQVSLWLQSEIQDGRQSDSKDGHQSESQDVRPLCSGTLISPCWVLTSAHCFSKYGRELSNYLVRVEASGKTITPEQVVIHRKFKGESGGHDIALLRLPSAKGLCLTFETNSNAACLPTPDNVGGKTLTSCITTVTTNWVGPDAVLQSWVPLLSSWQCKKRYGDGYSSHGTLCAGGPPDTSQFHGDSCQGNSGGGLVCQGEGGRWVLFGVVAGGYGCSDTSSPALYSRVSRFRSWIDEVTNIHTQSEQNISNTHTQSEQNIPNTHTQSEQNIPNTHTQSEQNIPNTHTQSQQNTQEEDRHTQEDNTHIEEQNKIIHDVVSYTKYQVTHMEDEVTRTQEKMKHAHIHDKLEHTRGIYATKEMHKANDLKQAHSNREKNGDIPHIHTHNHHTNALEKDTHTSATHTPNLV